ncbi:MAG: hypothetical protein OXN18_14290, partial [Gemmatimonadota bacterium]|nr:hypothetical protein [Gemmatimonadota bacterium]
WDRPPAEFVPPPQAGTASRTRRCGGCHQPQRNADFRLAADRQLTTDDARVKLKRPLSDL